MGARVAQGRHAATMLPTSPVAIWAAHERQILGEPLYGETPFRGLRAYLWLGIAILPPRAQAHSLSVRG